MNYDQKELKAAADKKVPTLFIELCDQRDSGWVLDGTGGTKNEQRLTSPSAEFIPNRGFRFVKDEATGEFYNEEIRYIKGQREISVVKQKAMGIQPTKMRLEDKIMIKGGNFSVERKGAYIGLYEYLTQVFYEEKAPGRPDGVRPLYRIKEIGKVEEVNNDRKLAAADAIQYIGTLQRRKGKGYEYDEPKINTLCNVFLVFSETYSGKISGLIAHAENDPIAFMDKALRFEQTIVTNVSHALELNLIRFDGNTAAYCNKEKVIADLGRGNISLDKKIKKLSDLFGTPEYKEIYEEFQVELAAVKEKEFTSK